VGLDIGTGATCIYLLLFAACTNVPYTLYGTEIDPESLRLAQQNVQSNTHKLQSLIHLFLVAPTEVQENVQRGNRQDAIGPLRRAYECLLPQRALDFCMTNPPFYDDAVGSERTDRRHGDGRDRTCMTVSEGSYPGGEVGFVLDMIVDGLYYYCRQAQQQQEQQQRPVVSPKAGQYNNTILVPPGWTSCMCCKKRSWILLKHVVTELLGPAHVCATEFTPGHLTRWFLAWTFEQPQMTSPLAQMEHTEFTVTLVASKEEVGKRIQEYCTSLPEWNLSTLVTDDDDDDDGASRIEIYEAKPLAQWVIGNDKLLPEQIQTVVEQMDPAIRLKFLPPQGHFLIAITLLVDGQEAVHASMEAFVHSTHGRKVVEKIKNQLQGEICRTNRRWRRKQKREQEASVMDES
jgi:23S rRNA A1618 N6-methylase RlmF